MFVVVRATCLQELALLAERLKAERRFDADEPSSELHSAGIAFAALADAMADMKCQAEPASRS